jgi:hypothetical protein
LYARAFGNKEVIAEAAARSGDTGPKKQKSRDWRGLKKDIW